MSILELEKLFDYILENRDIIISQDSVFNRDTLIRLRAIIKEKAVNDFELTKEQKEVIINSFINNGYSFDEDTPEVILNDFRSIKKVMDIDFRNINFIKKVNDLEIENYILDKVVEKKIILDWQSEVFLRKNYFVALNSIRLSSESANYIDWDSLSDLDEDALIQELCKTDYVISQNSPNSLRNNRIIIFNSIKKDINTFRYSGRSAVIYPEIFKYLLLNNYWLGSDEIGNRRLSELNDYEIFEKAMGRLFTGDLEYKKRINKLIFDAINLSPKIKEFNNIFEIVAEKAWNDHKFNSYGEYDNIFGKICAELKYNNNYVGAINKLKFLQEMKDVLGASYNQLEDAMKECFKIFHSDCIDKILLLQEPKEVISRLAAKYISRVKENIKKDKIEECNTIVYKHFTLRLDNPLVYKKLILTQKKKIFKNKFIDKDEDVCKFIDELRKKYSGVINERYFDAMVQHFIVFGVYNKLSSFISGPKYYNDYLRYLKAKKLIYRLNKNYISYDGVEVYNYKDIIIYDNNKKEYVYTGIEFYDSEIEEFNEYKNCEKIYNQIKRELIERIEKEEVDGEINKKIYSDVASELPFTDEYFVFDRKKFLDNCKLESLLLSLFGYKGEYDRQNIKNDKTYQMIYKLLVDKQLIWLLVFEKFSCIVYELEECIDKDVVKKIVKRMDEILSFEEFFDLDNLGELLKVLDICNEINVSHIYVLGKEIVFKLVNDDGYTSGDLQDIVNMAHDLVCQMVKKDKSTVPYISGVTTNYNYSMYDSQDVDILLSGINTDSCFRVCGTDNDFLHYCAINKNGFVIKITDNEGNFIAKASGLRNGNCVFINQLRTIYDEGGNHYNGKYENEKKDIINVFQKACLDIVETSQRNKLEENKIDFVFVTQSYSLKDMNSNVPSDVTNYIGEEIVNTNGEDWNDFVTNTLNLRDVSNESDDMFETDYGQYSLICMAWSNNISIRKEDIKLGDVPAVYKRKRNKIMVSIGNNDDKVIEKIKRISGIGTFYGNALEFEITKEAVCCVGDNWYIIYNNGEIAASYCLLDDVIAKIEYEAVLEVLEENKNNSQNIDKINEHVKKLVINNGD